MQQKMRNNSVINGLRPGDESIYIHTYIHTYMHAHNVIFTAADHLDQQISVDNAGTA